MDGVGEPQDQGTRDERTRGPEDQGPNQRTRTGGPEDQGTRRTKGFGQPYQVASTRTQPLLLLCMKLLWRGTREPKDQGSRRLGQPATTGPRQEPTSGKNLGPVVSMRDIKRSDPCSLSDRTSNIDNSNRMPHRVAPWPMSTLSGSCGVSYLSSRGA